MGLSNNSFLVLFINFDNEYNPPTEDGGNLLGSFIAIGLIEKYFKTIIQNTTSLKKGRGKPCPYKNLITHNS